MTLHRNDKKSCQNQAVEVESLDGICCPPLDSTLWQAHPRIYLPVKSGVTAVRCYYCGTQYIKKVKM